MLTTKFQFLTILFLSTLDHRKLLYTIKLQYVLNCSSKERWWNEFNAFRWMSVALCRFLLIYILPSMTGRFGCRFIERHRISENSNLLIVAVWIFGFFLFIIFIISSDFIWKTLRNSLRGFSPLSFLGSWNIFCVCASFWSIIFSGFIGFDFLGIWMKIGNQLAETGFLCYLW